LPLLFIYFSYGRKINTNLNISLHCLLSLGLTCSAELLWNTSNSFHRYCWTNRTIFF